SGQMVQAGVLLYKATGEEHFLKEAQRTAAACYDFFFEEFTPEGGEAFRILRKGNVWFSAVMVRGLIELYGVDGNATYVDAVRRSLDYAWDHARDEYGLFETDFTGADRQSEKWLLTQAAMVEMYARIHRLGLTAGK
ncbi:hydrolase, partial [human gut metagenome]